MGVKDIYLSYFRKNSPGREIYGYGFTFMWGYHSFLIGTKKREYRNSKKYTQRPPQKNLEKP
tara:strand:+ start:373 stop:558 length:186 start_codon:yes stop_codon:yes gene_type:complete